MLGTYRVLDLTDDRGNVAAFILAGLGADVVLIEPPTGSAGRRRGPFAGGRDDPERSLSFWAWNRGKRSAVLDLTTADGAAELGRLCEDIDVVFESGAVAVDLAALRRANPRLVTVSISAFGGTGPKAAWPATDLTVLAAGCQLAITGDADRAPVRTCVPQAFLHGAADAAVGALVALAERARSGLGQHVEVSAQRSVLQATQSYVLAVPLGGTAAQRMSGGVRTGGLDVQLLWPCKDGYASVSLLFGASIGPFTRRLMHWLHEEGYCDEATRDKDWIEYGSLLYRGAEPIEEYERVKRVVGEFCLGKTKAELLEAARSRGLLIAPVATPADVAQSAQFEARDYWDHVDDDALLDRPVAAPGPFVRSSVAPPMRLGRAPRLGEHTDAVLQASPRRASAPPETEAAPRGSPLDGLKVLDLTWAMAGPAMTRVLADFGATVLRVESGHHLDVARTIGPFVDDRPGSEASGLLFNMTTGKRSVGLDLRQPLARDVLDDLVRWADVVVESFSPRGRAVLALEYQRLVELNPSLIMMSSCLFGQSGPLERYAGFGTMGAALSGFFHLTGWPDRAPCGPFGAYSDYMSPRFGVCALLAAIDHRRRTGEGQYLDFAQAEAAVHFLSPAVLDYVVNGTVTTRDGNRDAAMVPHGVYPSAGDDEWIAVACRDDDDWRVLAGALERPDLADLTTAQRHSREAELDGVVASWTARQSVGAAAALLIAAGVPAHAVHNSGECAADPQLAHDGHFVTLAHSEHGRVVAENSRFRLEATPAVVDASPPLLGQDTIDVLTDVLHYSDDRIAELLASGALD
ncbi:MAG TPA: CoA transferase [Acidimicrobiales bacterium]|jgi:crotonobetainyl-CoA:carnitine CoA-transferase CaiB-like acyl-CoA transferase